MSHGHRAPGPPDHDHEGEKEQGEEEAHPEGGPGGAAVADGFAVGGGGPVVVPLLAALAGGFARRGRGGRFPVVLYGADGLDMCGVVGGEPRVDQRLAVQGFGLVALALDQAAQRLPVDAQPRLPQSVHRAGPQPVDPGLGVDEPPLGQDQQGRTALTGGLALLHPDHERVPVPAQRLDVVALPLLDVLVRQWLVQRDHHGAVLDHLGPALQLFGEPVGTGVGHRHRRPPGRTTTDNPTSTPRNDERPTAPIAPTPVA